MRKQKSTVLLLAIVTFVLSLNMMSCGNDGNDENGLEE